MSSNIPVNEFTSPNPYSVSLDTDYREMLSLMDRHGIRHLPVIKDGDLVGLVSDRDLNLVGFVAGKLSICAQDIMSSDPFMVSPETPIEDVALEMSKRKIGSSIVVSASGEVIGIFTATDALNALVEVLRGEINKQ